MRKPFFDHHDEIFIEYMCTHDKYDITVQQYHDAYEILFVINGDRTVFCNNVCYTLKRGDVAIISPFEFHYAESTDNVFYERYVVNFEESYLLNILTKDELNLLLKNFNSKILHTNEEQFEFILNNFKLADKFQKTKQPFSKKAIASCILNIILILNDIKETNVSHISEHISSDIIYAINYINIHYAENITLDSISDKIHISKFHFCRLFKDATSTTFLEYLNNVRLAHAHQYLSENKLSINEIAQRTGFGSAAYFSRMFKKYYGLSPRMFKKNILHEV